jgi:TetR/AcrR family transcriptional regulator
VYKNKNQCVTDTRHQIFNAAARLFADKGFHAVSMREISLESGVSKPMIYYYFHNKEGIYKALIEHGLEYNRYSMEKIQALPVPIREKLVQIIYQKFKDAESSPEFTKFYISLFVPSEKLSFLDAQSAEATDQSKFLVQLIEDAVEKGELAPHTDPRFVVEIIGGALMHLLWHQIKGIEPKPSRQLAENLVDLFLDGIKK